MNEKSLMDDIQKSAPFSGRVALCDFAYIETNVFEEQYKPYFEPDKYQKGKWRTKSFFYHLHAAPAADEGYVNIHVDHGNLNRSLIIGGLIHSVLGVLPWLCISVKNFGKIIMNPTMQQMKDVVGE